MKALSINLALLIILLSCGKKEDASVEIRRISDDQTISILSAKIVEDIKIASASASKDCKVHIKEITCLSHSTESGYDDQCSANEITEEMLERLYSITSDLPKAHLKTLCQMNRLQVHDEILSLGYASILEDNKNIPVGTMFGIRKDYLLGKVTERVMTWKEQLSFGISNREDVTYTISSKGPKLVQGIKGYDRYSLLYVVVHELSHLLDFMNKANVVTRTFDGADTFTFKASSDSFSTLSWPREFYFREDNFIWPSDFQKQHSLLLQKCYYDCNKFINPNNIDALYKELSNSTFLTSYSSTNEVEDFAEASTVIMLASKGSYYKVLNSQDKVVFDMQKQMAKPALKKKIDWIRKFYSRNNLIYQFDLIPE